MLEGWMPKGCFKPARSGRVLALLLAISYGAAYQAQAQVTRKPLASSPASSPTSGKMIEIDETNILLPDVIVSTHRGEEVRFYTDLIKDRVVLLSFIYTSCTNVCLMQGENLSKVQARLGARLGKDVFLISVSMDPQTDTPKKLSYWGKAFGAGPGWTLVSSKTPEINRLLKAFTGNSPGPQEMHASLVFIGNDRTGAWMTVEGLQDAASLAKLLIGLTGNEVSKQPN